MCEPISLNEKKNCFNKVNKTDIKINEKKN